ncbi:chymotrypsinogen B [Biomphalaria glabrata]|nr:chymotrypsinogen B [Biomphalaria glabrata]
MIISLLLSLMTFLWMILVVNGDNCTFDINPSLSIYEYERRYSRFIFKSYQKPRHFVRNWRLASKFNSSLCGRMVVDPSTTIYGLEARIAPVKSFPWHVTLLRKKKDLCNGILILSRWVLTIASCSLNTDQISIGIWNVNSLTSYEQEVKISKRFEHEDYNPWTAENNIALVRLQEEVKFNDYARPICFPTMETNFDSAAKCFVTSFGMTEPDSFMKGEFLRYSAVTILPQEACSYSRNLLSRNTDRRNICTNYDAATLCYGDDGIPLVCEVNGTYRLAGLFSSLNNLGDCVTPYFPAKYTRVFEYADWIYYVIEKNS